MCNYCVWLGALMESAFRHVIRSLRVKKRPPSMLSFNAPEGPIIFKLLELSSLYFNTKVVLPFDLTMFLVEDFHEISQIFSFVQF